ncbi:MAG TPA: tetratricopeptide repeat protein [Sedimentisphaerales bacterium]|jgi:tetratricopeptide (TPR) repeat protein|nr:tetratricopeptide repeat protein [Sedimentisphaerales bacterium]HNU28464.1 tetratricopeptide repeat protein [Sedimentisphaerales bacterium]
MARRRLNKKVALLGTAVSLLLVMAAVFVLLRLNRDPGPFIADGEAAWAARDYPKARENYARAYGYADTPEMKVDLLFRLSEVYRQLDQWDRVLACWEMVVTTDLSNVKAHLGRLAYFYTLADSLGPTGRSTSEYWEEVLSHVRTAIDVVEDAGLMSAKRADWEPSLGDGVERGAGRGANTLGTYLHFVKGRAALELASMGAVTSPGELLTEAQADLEEARKLDPNDAQVYRYLADVFVEKGKLAASAGNRTEQAAAEKQADEILAEAVLATPTSAESRIRVLARKLAGVQQGTVAQVREQIRVLEPEYEDLTRQFASSPQAFLAKAQLYSFYTACVDSVSAGVALDKAIAAARQAGSLGGDRAEYVLLAAGCQYRKSSICGDPSLLEAAIDLAVKGLELPDAQDTPGPTQIARRLNRLSLYSLLARCCIERILSLPGADPARQTLLARAETAVGQIRQIQGGKENPELLKWQGMLDLARGRAGEAVPSLYDAYLRIKAANASQQQDPFLSHTLATVFKDTAETGAVLDFLGTALTSGILHTKPEALLDYAEALLRVGSSDAALNATESFDERFGANDRSRVLRTQALLAKGRIEEAQETIARLRPDDPKAIALNLDLARAHTTRRAGDRDLTTEELRNQYRSQADFVQRLLQADPNAVEDADFVKLCQSLIEHGESSTAKALVESALKQSPDNLGALFYKALLSEADPARCAEPRRSEIREQAIRRIADPIRRSLELGLFYKQTQQADRAAAEWRSVLDATAVQGCQDMPSYLTTRSASPRSMAAGHLFDLARDQENWRLAAEVVELAKRENLDDCRGYLFSARLAFARRQYAAALTSLDECLKRRPIFSHGYMLRSRVRASLGREQESIDDIREASRLNPADPVIAAAKASVLHARNVRLGDRVSSEQQFETRQAMERAIQLNPRDAGLLSAYVDFLGDNDPVKAMALRQTIQIASPTLHNAVMLAKLATEAARKETDQSKRKAFLTVAETAFEQARQMDPNDLFMLDAYATYLRAQGQNDRARQLLAESNDSRLLWRHYLQVRDFDQARRLLLDGYARQDRRIDALKGLVLVAEETADQQGVKKYCEELLALEDSAINRLAAARAHLNVGLVGEAERQLQDLQAKYPSESRVSLLEAHLAKRCGQLPRAMDLVNRCLENDSRDAAAWQLRGEISLLMGDREQAILDFRKSLAIRDDPVTMIALARAQGRYDEAVDYIDQRIRLAGADTDAGIEHAFRKADLLTTAYEATSDKAYLAKAIAAYESLRAIMPNNSSVLNNLAYMLAQDDRRLAEALEYAKTAVRQTPDVAGYLDTYGYVLHKNGRNTEAAEVLAAAIRRYEAEGKTSAEVYEHLGMVNEALGQQEEARAAYRRALEIGGQAAPDAMKQRIDAAVRRLAKQG